MSTSASKPPLRLSIPDWGRTLGLGRVASYSAVKRCGIPVDLDRCVDFATATATYQALTQVRVTNGPGVDVRVVRVEALARAAAKAIRAGTFDEAAEDELRNAMADVPDALQDSYEADHIVWDRLCRHLFVPGTTTLKPEYRTK